MMEDMTKVYKWRSIVGNGSLQDVQNAGSRFPLTELFCAEWYTEIEAVGAFAKFADENKIYGYELELVCIYRV